MDISFIIINYNTRHYLEPCLESIVRYVTGITYEVIVVDNASNDESVDFLRKNHPQIKLILNDKNQGFAKANNQAAKIAKGDYLFLLNADTIILNNGLASAVEYMKANGIAVLGPKLLNEDGSLQGSFHKKNSLNQYVLDIFSLAFPLKGLLRRFENKPVEVPASPVSVGFLLGAALIIDNNVVRKLGLFDEDYFFTGEERDFCLRMLRAHKKIVYFPEFQITHYGGGGNPHSTFHLVNWAKASCILARKHGSFFSIILTKTGLSFFYISRATLFLVKRIFSQNTGFAGLARKYFYLFLWSLGLLNEKRLD